MPRCVFFFNIISFWFRFLLVVNKYYHYQQNKRRKRVENICIFAYLPLWPFFLEGRVVGRGAIPNLRIFTQGLIIELLHKNVHFKLTRTFNSGDKFSRKVTDSRKVKLTWPDVDRCEQSFDQLKVTSPNYPTTNRMDVHT